jgi:hypothetical protein
MNRKTKTIGMKFCPKSREVVTTKAFPNYSQVDYRGILVKRQKIGHLEEDGGCGCEWFIFEMPEDVLFGSM